MHRTQILLEDEQYKRLKAKSEETGRSIGDLVREAVDRDLGVADREELLEAFRAA